MYMIIISIKIIYPVYDSYMMMFQRHFPSIVATEITLYSSNC